MLPATNGMARFRQGESVSQKGVRVKFPVQGTAFGENDRREIHSDPFLLAIMRA
jgi:hypothetical protein